MIENYQPNCDNERHRELDEPSKLLEGLLVFSAGLSRTWPPHKIIKAYPLFHQFRRTYREMTERLIHNPKTLSVSNVDQLTDIFAQHSPKTLIIATAYHGHYVAFFCALARKGVPLAACYREADRAYLDALQANGVALIDLNARPNVYSLLTDLDYARLNGRYIVLLIDGPHPSRRRFDLLGYRIATSYLPSLYAQRVGASILPLITSVDASNNLTYSVTENIAPRSGDVTQRLLGLLQTVILSECHKYRWTAGSIILSDATARESISPFVEQAVAWRDSHLQR
jgi:lauroyl/myristoyl acyltransferase